ncbi:MAG: glycosyltransferase family 4 protein [Saprospiraceae bacterium]
MKIAIIADALDYQYAGIYYYTKELINALAKVDHKNEYWIVRSKSEGDINERVKELIIPTKKFPGAAAYRLFISIPRILAQKKMDIVVEPRHFGPFNLPKAIKRITVIHDLSPLHFPEWHQFVSRKLQQLFLPAILKRADYILTNSTFTANDVITHFPFTANKTKGILLGKENFFQPQSNPNVLKKHKLSTPYLLHTGTIEPRKNLIFLIKAFEALKQQINQPLQLVLVGKLGWKHTPILEAINNSPFKEDIKLLGYVDRAELPVLYTAAAAFVYPSHFEGFGLPVLEAMSCGTPTIVSNVSSLPEIIDQAGLLFPPNNQAILIQKIKQLLSDQSLSQSLSKKGLAQAAKFSWEKTARETLTIFEELLK